MTTPSPTPEPAPRPAPSRPATPRRSYGRRPDDIDRRTTLIKRCMIIMIVIAVVANLVQTSFKCAHRPAPAVSARTTAPVPAPEEAAPAGPAIEELAGPAEGPPAEILLLLVPGEPGATEAARAAMTVAAGEIEKKGRTVRTITAAQETDLFRRAIIEYAPARLPAVAAGAAGISPVIVCAPVSVQAILAACDRSAGATTENIVLPPLPPRKEP
ncbi:MAG: hypothetical protein ABIF71_06525 [Planctomycetota bacterium]